MCLHSCDYILGDIYNLDNLLLVKIFREVANSTTNYFLSFFLSLLPPPPFPSPSLAFSVSLFISLSLFLSADAVVHYSGSGVLTVYLAIKATVTPDRTIA